MSQRSVEQIVGRMATDEEFRRRFDEDRSTVLAELLAAGLPLTPIEQHAILNLDCGACEEFAGRLDPRILKMSLKRRTM